MDKWIVIIAITCLILALLLTVWNYHRNWKQQERIKRMIDAAIEGKFCESTFDETQFSQMENRLAEYLRSNEVSQGKLAKERDKIKVMISDISHQTKTPIANLLLYSELLREMEVPKEAKEYVEQMLRQSEKLQFLIDALVKLSRLETGIVKVSPIQEPVCNLIDEVAKSYTLKAEAKGLRLIVIPSDVKARFDLKWTQEAISTIVDNAIKYTECGEITISVRSYEMFVSIDIQDTGIGIGEDEQAQVFGRFYRGKRVHSQEGVGIGLFLAREIISEQGGYIKLRSNQSGSIFSVCLPKAEENLSEV